MRHENLEAIHNLSQWNWTISNPLGKRIFAFHKNYEIFIDSFVVDLSLHGVSTRHFEVWSERCRDKARVVGRILSNGLFEARSTQEVCIRVFLLSREMLRSSNALFVYETNKSFEPVNHEMKSRNWRHFPMWHRLTLGPLNCMGKQADFKKIFGLVRNFCNSIAEVILLYRDVCTESRRFKYSQESRKIVQKAKTKWEWEAKQEARTRAGGRREWSCRWGSVLRGTATNTFEFPATIGTTRYAVS